MKFNKNELLEKLIKNTYRLQSSFFYCLLIKFKGFPDVSAVKNPPTMQEMQDTWVRSLSWKVPCRRSWQPTPVFLLGESHGFYSPKGCKELNTTE